MSNPFPITRPRPGHGIIELALLPPSTPVLRTLAYQYPLKLISPAALALSNENEAAHLIHTIFVLTYGGGLVAGDSIDLHVSLAGATRLVMLTQGSTKIFKSPNRDVVTRQSMSMEIAPGAGLVYLPDPVQPFEKSAFEQRQVYNIVVPGGGVDDEGQQLGSLCALDWVCEGRSARGEKWSFWRYASRNEVFIVSAGDGQQQNGDGELGEQGKTGQQKRLLLRDNVLLDAVEEGIVDGIASRMDNLGVFGTLILYGELFSSLSLFFMDEFKLIPRIGARKWDTGSDSGTEEEVDQAEVGRKARQKQETVDGLLWTAASVRGCVVVKFGAREVEGGKRWLRRMLETEGSVVRQFGERALLCLR